MSTLTILILVFLFFPVFVWKNFEDAGEKGYKTIVPLYNYWTWINIVEKPWWWFIFILIPFINVFMVFLLLVETAKAYKKYALWEQALAVLVPFVYFPYLGTNKDEKFYLPAERPKVKKGFVREWVDAIIFAVVAATIIRMFMFENYMIPTPSMEKSLLVGDFLFVSKMAYGPKAPNTPLSFPFVHHTMPLSKDRKSFLEWIKLPYYRFPGPKEVKKLDAVVFNYPEGDTVSTVYQSNASYYSLVKRFGRERVWRDKANFGNIIYRPVDKRENYIKRCIATSGDTLQIIDAQVYINGQKQEYVPGLQFTYRIVTDGTPLRRKKLIDLGFSEKIQTDSYGAYVIPLTKEMASKIEALPNVISVMQYIESKGVSADYLFPFDTVNYKWNIDNYGPVYIPQKGASIQLNTNNLPLYKRLITTYEGNDLEVRGNDIYINKQKTDTYTFAMDYYWMMGDNRHNSADSRFWGFVPEDHIVGKASFVWLSLDKNKSGFGKIRWHKMFRKVK